MRKIKKAILFIISFFPLILYANTTEEIEWKWYTNIESNVHYEKDVENNCEYFEKIDKEKFMYGEWQYSLNKPKENENREIELESTNIILNKAITNMINITEFKMDTRPLKLKEIEIIDKDNNNIDYEVKSEFLSIDELSKLNDKKYDESIDIVPYYALKLYLTKTVNIKDIKLRLTYVKDNEDFKGLLYSIYLHDEIRTNSYAHYSTDIKKNCEEENCLMEINVRENDMSNEDISIRTNIYKFRDKYYKCYTHNRLYVPGYFNSLNGFIKDEENFKIKKEEKNEILTLPKEETTKKEELSNQNNTNLFNSTTTPVYKVIENETKEFETKNENDKKIAIVNNENQKKSKKTFIYDITLIILFLMAVVILIIKKVKNSRTK